MAIKEKLTEDMKTAMKAGHKEVLSVIRMILAQIQRKEQDIKDDAIKKGTEMPTIKEDDLVQVIQTFKKQTEEEREGYVKVGKAERAAQLEWSLNLIDEYLPAMLTKEQVRNVVDRLAIGLDNKGAIMKAIMPELKGKAENKLIAEVVDQFLKG